MNIRLLLQLLLAGVIASGLAACGTKGKLKTPTQIVNQEAKKAKKKAQQEKDAAEDAADKAEEGKAPAPVPASAPAEAGGAAHVDVLDPPAAFPPQPRMGR